MHSTFIVTVLCCGQESFILKGRLLDTVVSLINLGSKLLPVAMPLAKEAIASLGTGALSG